MTVGIKTLGQKEHIHKWKWDKSDTGVPNPSALWFSSGWTSLPWGRHHCRRLLQLFHITIIPNCCLASTCNPQLPPSFVGFAPSNFLAIACHLIKLMENTLITSRLKWCYLLYRFKVLHSQAQCFHLKLFSFVHTVPTVTKTLFLLYNVGLCHSLAKLPFLFFTWSKWHGLILTGLIKKISGFRCISGSVLGKGVRVMNKYNRASVFREHVGILLFTIQRPWYTL